MACWSWHLTVSEFILYFTSTSLGLLIVLVQTLTVAMKGMLFV